jgi:hypothetical protein
MQTITVPVGTSGPRGFPAAGSMALIALAVLEFVVWLPPYLTWPWWADHDVFATMAMGWSEGLRPYRDLIGNNFPGTIYFFWIVGKLAGWGNEAAYNAFDAILLGALGLATLFWSRRRFGAWLPGAVTLFALVTYYFNLDFSTVAQRDWHAALFAALAMIVLEVTSSTPGLLGSALFAAVAFSIRPQVLLFVPGLLWAACADEPPNVKTGASRRFTLWLVGFGGAVVLLFYPLLREGLVPDLVQGLASVMPGSRYSGPRWFQLLDVLRLCAQARAWVILPALMILWPSATARTRRSAGRWLLMLAGSVVYLTITPVVRPYSVHAFWLIWAFTFGVVVEMVRGEAVARPWPWSARAVAVLGLVMVLNVGQIPSALDLSSLKPALTALAEHRPVAEAPAGYRRVFGTVDFAPWDDYQATLAYLRTQLSPSTRVANALVGVAINGPTGRLPAFPAESANWLFVVRAEDEERFITTLRDSPDSVVVWSPEAPRQNSVVERFPRLAETIRTLYEPSARFGPIAIWRRKAGTAEPGSLKGRL